MAGSAGALEMKSASGSLRAAWRTVFTLAALIFVGEAAGKVPGAVERLQRVPFDRLLSRPPLGANHASAKAPCNIFTTSGTTSAPKFVLHRQGAIASHAQEVARAFGFGV